ncbi:MAG: TIM-barrel domain-containing protein [Phycisphaerales bacterium]|jgi:alpha-glucosidase
MNSSLCSRLLFAAAVTQVGAIFGLSAGFAQTVSESIGEHTVRFHASAADREAAHPSYALVREPEQKPAPPKFPVTPIFGNEGNKHTVHITIDQGTSLYGTGEVAGPLMRNGRTATAWNTDAYGYGDEAVSLYQSHPWVLAVRPDGSAFGVLADTTYRCTIDTAYTAPNEIRFTADGPAFPVIIINANSPQEVLKELGHLTGTMPMPPEWALGYHQCRYSYYPEKRAREIADEFRTRQIPCDVIWFDIDYMEAFRIFTFDRGYFPDPKKLNSDLLGQGFHTVWMIDPGMKSRTARGPSDRPEAELAAEGPEVAKARAAEIAKFDAIMSSGDKADVWVKRGDGTGYEGEVWPGWCRYPDYTNPNVRQWWSGLYKDFMAQGVCGVWNDMNEPAVFNVPTKTMPETNLHAGDPAMIKPNGKAQGDEAKGDHARYHNVYGMQMIRGTREGIQAINPDKRPFVLSRANYIGGQRYGATWTGDNTADWAHMEDSVPMSLNVGLSGQPFIGPDIGGFAGNGDAKLFARWFGFGAMLPFSRGHTGKGNINKEPWAFGPEVEATCREALNRRYRLMPYIYTLFHEASVDGIPVARPIFFADPKDPALRSEDDAFMLGADLIVAPQMVPDGSRVPTLPTGTWREIESSKNIDLPRLLVRGGAIVPMGPAQQYVGEKPLDPLTLLVCLDDGGKATGTLYEDGGDGLEYQQGQYLLSTYEAALGNGVVTVKLASSEGKMSRPSRKVTVRVVLHDKVMEGTGTDGQAISVQLK